ncbi:hypothetical protein IIA15_11975 [candidate division TA06 bacterium]|nr:hypothetical protein [candidate division TA06 bacterium]
MFLGAHTITILAIDNLTGTTLTERTEQVIEVVEASPAARVTLQFGHLGLVLRFIFVPAIIGGVYYGTRRRPFDNVKDKEFTLGTMAMFFFLAALINVVNDLGVLVSLL